MEDGRTRAVLIGVIVAAVLVAVGLRMFYGFNTLSQITLINRSVETISVTDDKVALLDVVNRKPGTYSKR